ncbi:hypothetical protein H4582DRAFT_2108355 [Lactarius indigo]|nr:hypothetical protein H4582DRAFT_2108355 [Lactarius indigo]
MDAARDQRKGKERSLGPVRTPVTHSHRVNKLDPPRPFPTVPAGVSATGPRSAHHEGKNYITSAYLRRCKDVVLKDGYKSLHLSALGAAIPHLFLTGTVDVQDELVPDDEDEDISYRTRAKSSLSVTVIIGDGVDESIVGGSKWAPRGKRRKRAALVWSNAEDVAASEPDLQEGDEQSDSAEP